MADPALREGLERFVRGKVPAAEVQDIVQSTLTDALAAAKAPESEEDLQRWIYGIARHKVADHFRRVAKERAPDSTDLCETPAESAPHGARDLLRWAKRELPDGQAAQDTLEWMLREGQGEKLEQIAEDAKLAAPRVRQRVSRLRRYFRERWAQQLAAVAAIVVLVLVGIWIWSNRTDPQPDIVQDVPNNIPPLDERVVDLRSRASKDCEASRWRRCLELLDEARALDPAGDRRADVQAMRRKVEEALRPAPEAPSPDVSAPPPAPPPIAPPRRTTDPSKPRPKAPKLPSDFGWGSKGPSEK